MPPHAPWSEAIGMILVCFGWPIVASVDALTRWRPGSGVGFTDNAFGGLFATEFIFGAIALLLLWARDYPLAALAPRPSWRGVPEGALLCAAVILAHHLLVPLLPRYPATPIDEILAASRVTWSVTVPAMLVNGTYEEVFLLGYLMRGLRRHGASTALGVTVCVRMLYHTYQGPVGVASNLAIGLLLGGYFLRTQRLFPVVLAHVLLDLAIFLVPRAW